MYGGLYTLLSGLRTLVQLGKARSRWVVGESPRISRGSALVDVQACYDILPSALVEGRETDSDPACCRREAVTCHSKTTISVDHVSVSSSFVYSGV